MVYFFKVFGVAASLLAIIKVKKGGKIEENSSVQGFLMGPWPKVVKPVRLGKIKKLVRDKFNEI